MENENTQVTQPTEGQEQQQPEKTFTKEQVNEIIQKRIGRSHESFFKRYGVKDLKELDDLFAKSKGYDATKKLYDEQTTSYNDLTAQHKDLSKKYAFKAGNINPEKISDIETYFKGKGLDIDEATLAEELKMHPDWINKPATVQAIGSEAADNNTVDEVAQAEKYFGVSLR